MITFSTDYEDDEYQEVNDSELDMQQTTSEYNKKKIADIDERIFNKTQARQVISSQRIDTTSNAKVCIYVVVDHKILIIYLVCLQKVYYFIRGKI